MASVNKRSIMTLFSGASCPYSHRVRFVLAEKGIQAEIHNVDADAVPEDLMELNPYGGVPTLVDRDLCLYEPKIIVEYLDERFPHPPMMPVDPVSRAKARLAQYRIERDWYGLLEDLEHGDKAARERAARALREELIAADELFAQEEWFLSEERTVMDLALAPLLWRLARYGADPGDDAPALRAYRERLFGLDVFQASLTDVERTMRG
ncbi:glutathione S-transferase N-terminal domain-containing protein [Aquisalimonas lutea]|uniref:glutathione S-transferase N-terminal domain-containing protein n=1 Tax=Aquisalimonas lutea TaxID=1327750 RepID=UPI0025B613F2|nr:glutathione S-transferase N-terminal domain-containing protein [Aquisalimonas lutea]MDN3517398.1 glutathione S-transferase N-terminal domain-containing protein [Aquisalimonas lutea]